MTVLKAVIVALVVGAWLWALGRFVGWIHRKNAEEFYGRRLGLGTTVDGTLKRDLVAR